MQQDERDVVLVVDTANVIGSRPDGWWRDRSGAATKVLDALAPLVGRTGVRRPASNPITVVRVVAVLEGQARTATVPAAVEAVLAPGSGDDEIVAVVRALVGHGADLLVVTADRGLRLRLPAGVATSGPGWLRETLGI